MSYIPDQFIFWCIEDFVESYGEINNSQRRRKMPALFLNNLHDVCSEFITDTLEFFAVKISKVGR
jgi:hypothetical protein